MILTPTNTTKITVDEYVVNFHAQNTNNYYGNPLHWCFKVNGRKNYDWHYSCVLM